MVGWHGRGLICHSCFEEGPPASLIVWGIHPRIGSVYPNGWVYSRAVTGNLKRIHVNRNTLASNKKHGNNNPVVGVEERGQPKRYGHRVNIMHDGQVVASVIHTEEKPLKCGARCWIETKNEVQIM
jgi:hypothetical protein